MFRRWSGRRVIKTYNRVPRVPGVTSRRHNCTHGGEQRWDPKDPDSGSVCGHTYRVEALFVRRNNYRVGTNRRTKVP